MKHHWIYTIVVVMLALCSCAGPTPAPTATLQPTPQPAPPTAIPTSTPQNLIVCTSEPTAVSPFVPSQAGDDLLALFFEPPLERVGYIWEARLVDHVPTIEAGEVITNIVPVPTGSRYVGETGLLQINEGNETLNLPQMVVTFHLKPDARWSDGEPLTTEDFILGYHLAQEPETTGHWRDLVERTERFRALNDHTLRWEGVPGYVSSDYAGFLFPPQPSHRWKGQRLAEILKDFTPPGTGPFDIVAWERGREIRLQPNPHYAGTPPQLAEIIFRFPQVDINEWPRLLEAGECDLILPDPAMRISWDLWNEVITPDGPALWASPSNSFLRLDFNLAPRHNRPSLLENKQMRLALASCIDRVALTTVLPDQALIPADSFLPAEHPAFNSEAASHITYNPQQGQALLHALGWYDTNRDGIREAHNVAGVENGQPLTFTLHLAPQYIFMAAHVSANLEACGARVEPQPMEAQLFYATGEASPLFGRTFDLALYGWQADPAYACGAWLSNRIPTLENEWQGENFSGYTSTPYDETCERALRAIKVEQQWAALSKAQTLLAQDSPTLFLGWRPIWFVARPEVQGLQPDSSNSATLWNSEALYVAAPQENREWRTENGE